MYRKANGWRPYLISVSILLVHEIIFHLATFYTIAKEGCALAYCVPPAMSLWSGGLHFHEVVVITLIIHGIKVHRDRRI